jgi:hypothetical protein
LSKSDFHGLTGGHGDGGALPSNDDGGDAPEDDAASPSRAPDAAEAPLPVLPNDGGAGGDAEVHGGPGEPDACEELASDGASCAAVTTQRVLRAPSAASVVARLSPPAGVRTRALGPVAANTAGKLWTFVRTGLEDVSRLPGIGADFTSTATTGSAHPWRCSLPAPSLPWSLNERLAADGVPELLFEHTAAERGFGTALRVGGFGAALADGARPVFLVRSYGAGYAEHDVEVANLAAGAARAVRPEQALFTHDELPFGLAIYNGAENTYAYACPRASRDVVAHCYVARAPKYRVSERAAYTFYAGLDNGDDGFDADITKAVPIFDGNDEALSVSFNTYLHAYLAVHAALDGPQAILRSAPHPWGPWAEQARVELERGAAPLLHELREQPSLTQDVLCGKRIVISHWVLREPLDAMPPHGEAVLSTLELQ